MSNLTPGSYTVVQTVPPGYTNTTPVTVNVTLTSGSTGTANYLDMQPGSIAGNVLVDVNGNGVADSNDTNGIAGVTITLQRPTVWSWPRISPVPAALTASPT